MAVTGIEARLYDALAAFVSEQAFSPALPVAYPNAGFAAPVATANGSGVKKGDPLPYLAMSFIPNTADVFGVEWDSDVDHQGLMQLSVFWPARQGLVKPLQIASQVAAAFAPGTKIDRNGLRIRIDRKPTVGGAVSESDLVQVPVTVSWRAFVPADA